MNSREEKFIVSNPTEILQIRGNNVPQKVMDEGDPLDISAETHSFYWERDVLKKDDYEPVAVTQDKRSCLTRAHYRGIVVWQQLNKKQDKPVAYFMNGFHTPTICCKRSNITYLHPSDLEGRMLLHGYLINKIKASWNEKPEKYDAKGYSDKVVNERVPLASRFTWDDINYYVLVAPAKTIEGLRVSTDLERRLLMVREK